MLNGIKVLVFSLLLSTTAMAAEQIEIVSGLPVVGTGGQIGIGITQILNTVQNQREYKFAVTMGGAGDAAALRAKALAKQNQNVVFFTGLSTITFNRIVNPDVGIDRDHDFIFSTGIGKNTLGILVAQDSPIKNVDDLVAFIKSRPKSYSGGALVAPAATMMNQIFLKHYGLEDKVEEIQYKTVPEIVLAIENKEIDYTVFTLPDMTSLRAIIVSSDMRMKNFPDAPTGKEIGFNDFNLQSILLFAIPKEKPEFAKTFLADMKLACASPDFKTVAELRAPYMSYCMDPNDTEATVKNELSYLNKIYGDKH